MDRVRQGISWNRSLETGVAEMDEQHLILVHTLNEAAGRLAAESGDDRLGQITQDLLAYALYHFETEELLMQECGYQEGAPADWSAHLAQHRSFSAKVVSFREALKSGNPIAMDELLGFLSDWLADHILQTDKRLGAFVLEKRRGRP